MKNNDFDFIKNRFDSVEPSMPDSLNKEILRQKFHQMKSIKRLNLSRKRITLNRLFLLPLASY